MTSAEYNRELYHWLKERHLCTKCKRMDAYTMIGRAYCAECAKTGAEYKRTKYQTNEEFRERRKLESRERRQTRKSAGICICCGARRASPGHTRCASCLALSRVETPAYLPPGICARCRRKPIFDGKKLCAGCYEVAMQSLKIAWEKQDTRNHIWRKLDTADIKRQRGAKSYGYE